MHDPWVRESRDLRRAMAGMYVLLGSLSIVLAWTSTNFLLFVPGVALFPLAAWALRSYPIDGDW